MQRTILLSSTLYRAEFPAERARAAAALCSLRAARQQRLPVVLVDAGSDADFLLQARMLGAEVAPQQGGTLGAARRQAIRMALQTDAQLLVYTELEKDSFLQCLPKILAAIPNASGVFLIPARESLHSYPAFQAQSEQRLNRVFKELTGLPLDVAFGPRIWSRELSKYFLDYQGEYGDSWEFLFIPLLRALAEAVTLSSCSIDYTNPPDQSAAEQHSSQYFIKRQLQCDSITAALRAESTKLQLAESSAFAIVR
jgi:hypothetical protein